MKQTIRTIVGVLILAGFGRVETALAFQTSGFQQIQVNSGLGGPTAMEFAPDGRLFVAQQPGYVRVIKNGTRLPTPFVTLSVADNNERGLLGIAFDPNFGSNRFVYLYYTRSTSPIKNRVSRFTASVANPDVAQAGSEVVILDNIGSDSGYHNGGAIHFGLDGKLYVAVGDGGSNPSNSQSLGTLSGKLLRINPDGTVPSDNPFVGTPGARGEIWALGLRNPFTFGVDPLTGKIYINDVGESAWEEINLGARGANYGWPTCEGTCNNANFTNPIYTYNHSVGQAITGGVFYRSNQFPSQYYGSYFFSDWVSGWIKRLDTNNQVSDFWNPQNGPVDLKVGPDGALYYLTQFNGAVYKIEVISGNRSPTASFTATPSSGKAPLSVNFNAGDSSDPDGDPLTYTWNFGDGSPAGSGVSVNHTYQNAGSFVAALTVSDGRGGTATASKTIAVGTPPVGAILTPSAGTTYNAGDTISYSGSATDAEDGTLPASRFSWTIVFHHDSHTHPFLGPINGVTSSKFQIPQTGESSANTFYRIHLTVTDSSGLSQETAVDILPNKSTLTLATNIPGLSLTLDGQPVATPFSFQGIVGFIRTLGAPSPQTAGGETYSFVSWSDQSEQTHDITTPAINTTYTATYKIVSRPPPPPPPPPPPVSIEDISCNPNEIDGGQKTTCTLWITSGRDYDVEVVIHSGNPTLVTVPQYVYVPASSLSMTFTATTRAVDNSQTVEIIALLGPTRKTTTVTLRAGVRVLQLAFVPRDAITGQTLTGTVTLSGPVPAGSFTTVQLTSSSPLLTMPLSVAVPAGSTTASFTAIVGPVGADTRVTVTATLNATVQQVVQLLVGQPYAIPNSGGLSLTTAGISVNYPTVGYARIQASSGSTPAGVAIFAFRQNNTLISEAGVPATPLTRNGRIYAEVEGPVTTGVAIANPSDQGVTVNFYFTDLNGNNFGNGSTLIPARGQIAKFLNEAPFNGPVPMQGTFTFTSTQPVGVIALRGFTNERSEFLMTTLPVAGLAAGLADMAVVAHFPDGRGWTTQLVLINGSDEPMKGKVQFYDQGAQDSAASPVRLAMAINAEAVATDFPYAIAPRSSTKLTTTSTAATIQTGSIRIIPDPDTRLPVGVGIFSFDSNGIRVSEASVSTTSPASRFRLYAEATTGVAITNTAANPANITLTLNDLQGATVGNGTLPLAGNGQAALFISEVPWLGSIPAAFQGILQITADQPVSVVGLRGRYNERGDFLITTIPGIDEAASVTGEQIFPHLVDGGGYSTQVILQATGSGSQSGIVRFINQSGQATPVIHNPR